MIVTPPPANTDGAPKPRPQSDTCARFSGDRPQGGGQRLLFPTARTAIPNSHQRTRL